MRTLFTLLPVLIGLPVMVLAEEPVDLSQEIAGLLAGSKVPSLAAAAVLDGRIVSVGASGVRKRGDETKVTIDDKYHIGSCTKSMTATLVAMLVEAGKLQWETTVSEVFGDLEIHEDFRKVTLRQLVTNTGGVPGDIEEGLWADLWKAKGSERDQRTQLVKGILKAAPACAPGTKQVYSNAGFSIAGAMIEKRMDRPFEELLSGMLFEPLSMGSAGFRAPAGKGKVDQPYGHAERESMVLPVDPEPRGDNPSAIAPAGAVHCSIGDFAKYALFHLGAATGQILSAESLEILHTPENGRDYAMGWTVTDREWAGGRALTHAGSNTMFYAVIWLAPEKKFGAVALCNYGGKEGFQKCDEAIGHLIKRHL